jgi:hypothetical protein
MGLACDAGGRGYRVWWPYRRRVERHDVGVGTERSRGNVDCAAPTHWSVVDARDVGDVGIDRRNRSDGDRLDGAIGRAARFAVDRRSTGVGARVRAVGRLRRDFVLQAAPTGACGVPARAR